MRKGWPALRPRGPQAASPKESRERVVDALEVVNAERQAAHTQLATVAWAIKYIAEAVYHHFVVGQEDSDGERGGTVVPQ